MGIYFFLFSPPTSVFVLTFILPIRLFQLLTCVFVRSSTTFPNFTISFASSFFCSSIFWPELCFCYFSVIFACRWAAHLLPWWVSLFLPCSFYSSHLWRGPLFFLTSSSSHSSPVSPFSSSHAPSAVAWRWFSPIIRPLFGWSLFPITMFSPQTCG